MQLLCPQKGTTYALFWLLQYILKWQVEHNKLCLDVFDSINWTGHDLEQMIQNWWTVYSFFWRSNDPLLACHQTYFFKSALKKSPWWTRLAFLPSGRLLFLCIAYRLCWLHDRILLQSDCLCKGFFKAQRIDNVPLAKDLYILLVWYVVVGV